MAAVLQDFQKANNRTFHEVLIGEHCFRGLMSPWAGVVLWDVKKKAAWHEPGSCSIGRAVLVETPTGGWSVCKYGDPCQVHIDLPEFSEAQALQLAGEFGLPILRRGSAWKTADRFYESPSYAGLIRWVGLHKRMAKASFEGSRSELLGLHDCRNRVFTDAALN